MAVVIAAGAVSAVGAMPSFAESRSASAWRVQIPDVERAPYEYDKPPKQPEVPDASIPPSNKPLGPEELQRAEALLPMLGGKQELWAIGEFVHLGKPVVPVLVKALTMSSPRIRYNAIETLLLIKDPSAAPALIPVAKDPNEMPRVREHALRVAVRLDPALAPQAIEAMVKDTEPVIRKVAAFEARYVRQKSVVQPLIDLLADEERFVSVTAIQSLWMLTRHESEMHNWEASTKQEREEWAKEWTDWWVSDRETFQLPEPRQPRKPLPQN
ncbi:MAG: HEAT repeat domain-containing protein [Nitrospiraceae bacterium]